MGLAFKIQRLALGALRHSILLLASGIALLPLIACVLVSLKSQAELLKADFFSFGGTLHWENYVQALESGLARAFGTTFVAAVVAVSISCLLNAMAAYALCRFTFRGQRIVYGLILLAFFLPVITMQVYVFQMMVKMNMVNTLGGYILLLCGVEPVSIYLFSNYFASIPKAIDEAAILDGCGYIRIFFQIHMPLLRQAFVTAAVIRFIFVYNEYYLASIYLLDKSRLQTVTTALAFLSSPVAANESVLYAGVFLAILPTVALFFLFQKQIRSSLQPTRHIEWEL